MATPGSPWVCETVVIVEALKKSKGRVTHAARALGVAYETLRRRLNSEPELKDLLTELRNEFDMTLLDSAEDCLLNAMSKQNEDMGNALKSAFYILNNKGGDLGYSYKNLNTQESKESENAAGAAEFIRLQNESMKMDIQLKKSKLKEQESEE